MPRPKVICPYSLMGGKCIHTECLTCHGLIRARELFTKTCRHCAQLRAGNCARIGSVIVIPGDENIEHIFLVPKEGFYKHDDYISKHYHEMQKLVGQKRIIDITYDISSISESDKYHDVVRAIVHARAIVCKSGQKYTLDDYDIEKFFGVSVDKACFSIDLLGKSIVVYESNCKNPVFMQKLIELSHVRCSYECM